MPITGVFALVFLPFSPFLPTEIPAEAVKGGSKTSAKNLDAIFIGFLFYCCCNYNYLWWCFFHDLFLSRSLVVSPTWLTLSRRSASTSIRGMFVFEISVKPQNNELFLPNTQRECSSEDMSSFWKNLTFEST